MSDIAEKTIDKNTADLLKQVADFEGKFKGAFNIRSNGGCLGRKSSENIKIESKADNPGLDISSPRIQRERRSSSRPASRLQALTTSSTTISTWVKAPE